jgi:hypothetical protein
MKEVEKAQIYTTEIYDAEFKCVFNVTNAAVKRAHA